MKKFLNFSIIILFLIIYTESFGQIRKSSQNSEFEEFFKKDCLDKNTEMEIFQVMMTPPLLSNISQKKFKSDIKEIIKKNCQYSIKESEIKINIYTILDYGVCIGEIFATKGTSKELTKKILEYIEQFKNIKPGKQGGIERNSISEIRIKIKKNRLKELNIYNLKFVR
ncbi:MAG TPA: hypothetical protein ENK91_10445 [Bacteroidetes bacterium]|nr:hypothetical protein [Bacteroidota bacterium]